MKSLEQMIDNALQVCESKSDVARTIGQTPQRLYEFASGRRHMPATHVMRLATLANMNAVLELGRYEAEWSAKKIPRAAAGIAGAAFILGALSMGPGAEAHPVMMRSHSAHYAQLRRWLLRLRLSASARGAGTPSAPTGLPYMLRDRLGRLTNVELAFRG